MNDTKGRLKDIVRYAEFQFSGLLALFHERSALTFSIQFLL